MRRASGFTHFCCFSHQLKPCPQRLLGVITRPSGRASLWISGFAGGSSSPHAVRESVKDASNTAYLKVFISCSLTCVYLARVFPDCSAARRKNKDIWINRRLFYQGIPFRATKAGKCRLSGESGGFPFPHGGAGEREYCHPGSSQFSEAIFMPHHALRERQLSFFRNVRAE